MLKSYIFVVLLKLSLNIIEVAADNSQTYVHKYEAQFSLGCILFKNMGCDMECFVTADAFGRLGAGICLKGNLCDCGFASDLSLEGLWREKFANSENILKEIKSNNHLANDIGMILAQPYKTGQQTKMELLPYLTRTQADWLWVTDTTPAAKINPSLTHYSFNEIKNHVAQKLPSMINLYHKELTTQAGEYKSVLRAALHDTKLNGYDIMHLVRQSQIKPLNDIVDEYLTKYGIKEQEFKEPVIGIDKISYVVVDELIKKVDKNKFQIWLNWFKTTFSSLLNSCFTSQNSNLVAKAIATPGPINHDWRYDGITIRYRRNHQGIINLTWTDQFDRVCIFKTATSDINQSWLFHGIMYFSLSRSSDGSLNQSWHFGQLAYKYQEVPDPGGFANEEWINGSPNEIILNDYKKMITTWCTQHEFLIARQFCIIYENMN